MSTNNFPPQFKLKCCYNWVGCDCFCYERLRWFSSGVDEDIANRVQEKINAIFDLTKWIKSWLKHWHKPNHNFRLVNWLKCWTINGKWMHRVQSFCLSSTWGWRRSQVFKSLGLDSEWWCWWLPYCWMFVDKNSGECYKPTSYNTYKGVRYLITVAQRTSHLSRWFVPLSLKLRLLRIHTQIAKDCKYSDTPQEKKSFQCSAKCATTCWIGETLRLNINNGWRSEKKSGKCSYFPLPASYFMYIKRVMNTTFHPHAQDRNPDEWREC